MFRSSITGKPLALKVKPLDRLTRQQKDANIGGPQSFTGQPAQVSSQGRVMGQQVSAPKFGMVKPGEGIPRELHNGGPQIQGSGVKSSKASKGFAVSSSIATPSKFVKKRNMVSRF